MNRLDKFYRIEKQHFQFNEIMKWNRNKSLKLTTFNRKKNKCIFFPQHLQDKTADFYTWPLQNINRYIQKLPSHKFDYKKYCWSDNSNPSVNFKYCFENLFRNSHNLWNRSSETLFFVEHMFMQLLQFLNFGFSEWGNTTAIHLNWRFRSFRYIDLTRSVIPVVIPP